MCCDCGSCWCGWSSFCFPCCAQLVRPSAASGDLTPQQASPSLVTRPRGQSPSPSPPSRYRERSYRSSSESSEDARAETSPPRAGRAPGGRPGDSRPAPAGGRSPRPGPSGWTARLSTGAERYRSGGGRRSPAPSGVADDDRSSAFDSVNFDRDDSFQSVLALIQSFHNMEEPAGIPSAPCKTSLASIYGLMSETSPAFHLPTSPLMRSLLDDTNLALSKFLEDQTVHGFLPVPGRRHRRYYRTSSSSFPGPYSVPPGVTWITLEKASEARKRSVSLSASQVSSLETMLSGVCEVASWLDWWLSMCGGFPEHLLDEVRADFERLMLSGSRALEFLASLSSTALGGGTKVVRGQGYIMMMSSDMLHGKSYILRCIGDHLLASKKPKGTSGGKSQKALKLVKMYHKSNSGALDCI